MRQWLFGLASAAAALVLTPLPATAQTPDRPDETGGLLVAVDPRAGTDAAGAVAAALNAADAAPWSHAIFAGQCGLPLEIRPEPAAETAAARRFDPDSAMRAAIAAGARALLVVAAGPAECLSVACALSASWSEAEQPMRIDVLALDPAGDDLRCLAENTGGEWQLVTPETLAEAVTGLPLPARAEPAADGTDTTAAGDQPAAKTASGGAAPAGQAAGAEDDAAADPGSAEASADAPLPPARQEEQQTAPPAWDGFPPLPRPRPGQEDDGENAAASPETGDPPAEAEDGGATPFEWAVQPPGAPESEPPPPMDEPGIRFLVLAGPRGPLIETDLSFEILAPAGDGTYRRVAESADIRPVFPLAEGNYVARVSHGQVEREFPFAVSGEGIDHAALSLDIGYVTLSIRPTANAAPLESGITYTVTRLDRAGAGTPATLLRAAQPTIALPAGDYRITAQSDQIKSSREVTVKAGDVVKQDFNLRIGYLRLAVPIGVEDITLQVEALSSAGPGAPEVIASANGQTALFRLQQGNYIAVATANGERTEMIAAIKQGELTELRLPLSQQPQTHWWVQPQSDPPQD